jgi:hypothetical protein
MDYLRSIRSSSRDRTSERGFVLAAAIILAVLYLGLIELLLLDGTRALQEAQRFRSRVVALTLAESAAELAAAQMVNNTNANVSVETSDGSLTGTLMKTSTLTGSDQNFELIGDANTKGVAPQHAHVRVQGRVVDGTRVVIDYTTHSQ